jgi:hypothetical protein
MDDLEMFEEMRRRAEAAGEACGLYLQNAVSVTYQDGPVRPPQLAVRYAVGARAFLPSPDVAAIEARRKELEWMEGAVGPSREQLRKEAEAGPLGDLERGGA